ncbi:MAG: recombinase RecA [Malacoplasma sp.]
MENQELKIFNETIKEIEKKYGKGSLKMMSDNIKDVDVISTGNLNLDNALGINGLPKGRIIELYGNESSGKTTIALQVVAECQKNKGRAAYIDVENALDYKYIKNIGINLDDLIIANPEHGEQAFSIIDALIKTNLIDLIVIDSVAALIPQSEFNSTIEDQNIGAHARLMSKGLRMIQSSISKANVCVIFINQLREKVGIMFGNPEVTTGGRALKFFSSIRMEVKKSELLKTGHELDGIKSKVTIVKNKLAPPLKSCFVDIFFGKGFDYKNDIMNFAIEYEIIKKNGSWYYYNEKKLAQGKTQLSQFLNENEDIFNEIKTNVLEKLDK